MLRIILLTAAFILFSIQNLSAQRINIGVKGGVNLANISNSGSSGSFPFNTENKTGLGIYLFSDFYTIKDFTLGGEAGYVQKGYRFELIKLNESGDATGRGYVNSRLNYISIGLPFKFKYNKGNVNPYAVISPRVDFYTGYSISTNDLSGFTDSLYVNTPDPVLEDYKETVLGLSGGAGIEFKGIIPGAIIFEARYLLDFTNSYDKNSLDLKNKVLEFNIGIKF